MLPDEALIILCIGIFCIAFMYSAVGHAGASGYLALMTLAHLPHENIRPAVLTMNIAVAMVGSFHFYKTGLLKMRLLLPFIVFSIPMAMICGYVKVSIKYFSLFAGVVLILSALRLIFVLPVKLTPRPLSISLSMIVGLVLGAMAGITGTGGGIFLTPVLVFMGWAGIKEAAVISVFFILVNSIAGLLGNIVSTGTYPGISWAFLVSAVLGGFWGSRNGATALTEKYLRRILSFVLLVAGVKLIIV